MKHPEAPAMHALDDLRIGERRFEEVRCIREEWVSERSERLMKRSIIQAQWSTPAVHLHLLLKGLPWTSGSKRGIARKLCRAGLDKEGPERESRNAIAMAELQVHDGDTRAKESLLTNQSEVWPFDRYRQLRVVLRWYGKRRCSNKGGIMMPFKNVLGVTSTRHQPHDTLELADPHYGYYD